MDDLSSQLSAILQNPETQKNIQAMLSSLQNNNTPAPEQNPPPFDFSSLFQQNQPPFEQKPALPDIDIGMLMKIQNIFSKMNCDDQNVNLLMALRPHLRQQKKVDEAINILRLLSVLPALGEIGIFGGGFN